MLGKLRHLFYRLIEFVVDAGELSHLLPIVAELVVLHFFLNEHVCQVADIHIQLFHFCFVGGSHIRHLRSDTDVLLAELVVLVNETVDLIVQSFHVPQ